MHELGLLHKVLKKSSALKHEKRLDSLLLATQAAMHHQKLTLTGLGRHLSGVAKVKHKIKQMDRLLGNAKLHTERADIYQAVSQHLLMGAQCAQIALDWSPVSDSTLHMLRATLLLEGRGIPVYEEIHEEKAQGQSRVHDAFLTQLSAQLPKDLEVLIISDAGFKCPWYQSVEKQGWYWLGRVRGNSSCYQEDKSWFDVSALHADAKGEAEFFGTCLLTKTHCLQADIYRYKEAAKGRVKKSKRGKALSKATHTNKKHCKRNHEPWILATNLPKEVGAKAVVACYSKRVQIEESFRDSKNHQWGFGLSDSRTQDKERLQILLLIGALATFMLWLIGYIAEKNKWHWQFQANTVRGHRVLSYTFLARQVLFHMKMRLTYQELEDALDKIRRLYCTGWAQL